MRSFILRSIAERSAEEKKRSESSKRQRRKEKTVALPACIVFRATEATLLPRTLTTAQQKIRTRITRLKGYSGQLQFYRKRKKELVSGLSNQANKSTGWMPMAPSAEERRGQLRKATGSRKQALIRGYLNGETRLW